MLCLFIHSGLAQFTYHLNERVPVIENDQPLDNAWSGGFNSPQFSKMDLNGDGMEDLVIFDRTSSTIYPYVRSGGKYVFSPDYRNQFPREIRNWMLLRDFNCDGRKDIFANDPRGIVVYENITSTGGALQWRAFNERENGLKHLLSQGFSSVININVVPQNLPAIDDVDGDGDLDILAFRFSADPTVVYHKNLSMELDGNCDSLQFELQTEKWGDFEECGCGVFALNNSDCPAGNGGRIEHQSAKALLTLDLNGDNLKEAIVSEEECTELFVLNNDGTQQEAVFNSIEYNFPSANNPGRLFIFPAAYAEDIDSDGVRDLLIAPNVAANVGGGVNFESSAWFYKNTGSENFPNYSLIKKNFLQEGTIDHGENAAPAFMDLDGDGDLDMIVSSFINIEDFGFKSTLILYENVGTASDPAFELVDNDFLSFSFLNVINLRPKFCDINRDGRKDLVWSATSRNNGITSLNYLLNTSDRGFQSSQQIEYLLEVGRNFPNNDIFELYDINQDGLMDLLMGRSTGRLEYYRNVGTLDEPDFQLEDESFYGLDFSPFRQHPAVVIADYDGDGNDDMLMGDTGGNLVIYDNFLSSLDAPRAGITQIIYDSLSQDSTAMRVGSRLYPVVANIFNADKPAVLIGTGAGGVVLLEHTQAESTPVAPITGDFLIYPNPVIKGSPLNVGVASKSAISIISLKGQPIIQNHIVEAGTTVELPTDNLRAGLYLLKVQNINRIKVTPFVVVE